MANKIGIVLALDGEREFTQGMKNAKAASKELDTQINDLKKTYSDNANSLEALAKKQDLLKQKQEALKNAQSNAQAAYDKSTESVRKQEEAVARLTDELKQEKDALSKMSKSDAGYAKQEASVQRVANALDKQKANLLQAQQQQNKWNTELAKSKGAVAENTTEINKNAKYVEEASKSADKHAKSLDKMGNEAKQAGEKSKTMGQNLKTALAVAAGNLAADAVRALKNELVDAAKYVIDVGSSFEASMSEVAAISGASASELERMASVAKELGSSTKFSASEISSGFKYMSLAGWETADMLNAIDGVVNLAAASQMDLAKASDMVTDYLSAFGKEASDAITMADQMAYAQAHSNTSVEQLGEAYKNSAANMHAAGQEMETTTAILEALANQGTKGATAGTGLAAMMADITKSMQDGKIQIGDTAVAVTDASGNFRNLIDILGDVESAVNGMGTAERTAALSSTFQRKSIVAVNEVLAEGVSKVKGYEQALYGASGTAAKMAATMQDNLKGAVTKFGSALEGLGIAIYEKISGPLTSLVNFGSDIISGLTEVLDPAKTMLQQYMDDVQGAIEDAASAVDDANTTMTNAFAAAERVSSLGAELEQLNGIEEKTAEEKAKIRTLVDQLKDSVPGLADAFDQETGALELTNAELDDMLNKSIDSAIEQALQSAKQVLYAGELAAIAQKQNAESNLAIARQNHEAAAAQYDALTDAYEKYSTAMRNAETAGDGVEAAKWIQEAEKQQAVIEGLGYTVDTYAQGLTELSANVASTAEEEKKATEQYEELSEAVEGFASKYEELDSAAEEMAEKEKGRLAEKTDAVRKEAAEREKLAAAQKALDEEMAASASDSAAKVIMAAKKQGEAVDKSSTIFDSLTERKEEDSKVTKAFTNELEENTEAINENAAAAEEDSGALDEMSESAEKASENHKKIMAAVQHVNQVLAEGSEAARIHHEWQARLGETAKNSAEAVKKAWEEMKQAASQTIKFDIFSGFDGGTDQTTETMNANLQSQIDGLEQYYNDLRTISQHIGQEVTPEFFQYIEAMGTDGANMLRHMVWTLENQGDEGVDQIRGLSEKYAEAMAWQDIISAAIAGDTAALTDGLKAMGSTSIEFSSLKTAISNGLDGADQELKSKIESLVQNAETVGATIPEGLTDAIESGEISADDVQTQLESAISGAVDGVASIIEEQGGKVPENLVNGIKDGSADVEAAWEELVSNLSETISTDGIASVGESVATSLGDSISENSSTVSNAVDEALDAAETAAAGHEQDFQTAGENFASKMAAGLRNNSNQITSAASEATAAAKNAANNGSSQTSYIGLNMVLGIVSGIQSGAGILAGAAAAVVRQAIAAMKAAGDIRSPSRKTKKEVGLMMAKGTALGIALGQKDVNNAGTSMVESVIYEAVKAAQGLSGTVANALWDSVTSRAISNKFGVVNYTETTDSKGNTTRTKKSTEQYNNEILSNAKEFFSQLSLYQDMSIDDQIEYWTAVRSQLRVGTAAYAEATRTINSLIEENNRIAQSAKEAAEAEAALIGNFDAMSSGWDAMTAFWDMNEAAEVEYWDRVRQTYKEGTADRIKADMQYYNSKRNLVKKLEDIEKNYANTILEIDKQLARDRESVIQGHIDQVASAFGIFDEFESSSPTGSQLLFNIESQSEGYKLWEEELDKLAERGILSDELLDAITKEGPKATAQVIALNTLSDDELRRYNNAYLEKMDISTIQGTKDSEKEIEALEKTAAEQRELADKNRKEQTEALIGALDSEQIILTGVITGALTDTQIAIIAAIKEAKEEDVAGIVSGAYESEGKPAGSTGGIPSKTISSSSSASDEANKSAKERMKKLIEDEIKKLTTQWNEAKGLRDSYKTDYNKYKNAGKTSKATEAYNKYIEYKMHAAETKKRIDELNKKLKSGSYRRGSRRLLEDWAWMDEEGPGSEAIIRASDNAILRYAGKGSAITDAQTTANIFDWGKFNPADLTDLVSAAALNASLENGYRGASGGRAASDDRIDAVVGLLADYLPYLAEKTRVEIGRDAITDAVSADMAARVRRRR